jgi:hypothetical protein
LRIQTYKTAREFTRRLVFCAALPRRNRQFSAVFVHFIAIHLSAPSRPNTVQSLNETRPAAKPTTSQPQNGLPQRITIMQRQHQTSFSDFPHSRKWTLSAALIAMATISLALIYGGSGLVADNEPFAHQTVKQAAPFADKNAIARLDIPVGTFSTSSLS